MPYIDTTPALSPYKLKEGNLQEGFKNLLIKNGWQEELSFKKAVTSVDFVTTRQNNDKGEDCFAVAKHVIVRNARGDKLGVAVVSKWKADIDHALGFPYYNLFDNNQTNKQDLLDYLEEKFIEGKQETTLYFYMVEKLPNVEDGETILAHYGEVLEEDKVLQMALDVELLELDYIETSEGIKEVIKTFNPTVMQSPITEVKLRAAITDNDDFYANTNWWADSEISVQGYLDSNNIFVIMQTDNTPMWEDNLVPVVPFYFGDIVPVDEGDPAVALFAGTVPEGDTKSYDFDNHEVRGGKTIMPIKKTYPRVPSNGIDSVMINRTKLGARYQSYYLSWSTAPNEMPPLRVGGEDNEKQYPRAIDYKGYQFNPSRYSGKVQTSRVYLVHPEEGVRGYLKNAVGLNSASINASELRIRKEECVERIFDVYQCVPVSAISPLTKRPSTHYRPMGLGLFKHELNIDNPFKPDKNGTIPPSDVINLTAVHIVDGVVEVSWENPTDPNFSSVKIFLDGQEVAVGVTGVNSYILSGVAEGDHTIKVVAVGLTGNESEGIETNVVVS